MSELDPGRIARRVLRPVHRTWNASKIVEGPGPVRLRGGFSGHHNEGDNGWRLIRPGVTGDQQRLRLPDVDMGQNDVNLHNTLALPKNPTFKGSTTDEQRVFMTAYNLYTSETYALTADGEWVLWKETQGIVKNIMHAVKLASLNRGVINVEAASETTYLSSSEDPGSRRETFPALFRKHRLFVY
ncbi:hypothetical protein H257_16952 [Aphanomyces astaci]|uniref:Uncharacterized protein n=1 Tax=Aphanomyces astaci TaxID=112090 RepID=W4FIU9_APHAT|nr:hypothetical protein H257_16952 [Aphanomyces astaci]ETV66648.1 hypothetical protein H257_16952 [Aphanomyces astaci]|eukprot:XP_009843876.1 hypothetical protein H257_16952 [Aphanomyces astaci]